MKRKMKGISLIELMVSMTLGLTIIGGLMSMYLGSRETDKTRTELIDIESNARFALNALRQTISHAGYASVESIPLQKPFQTPSDGVIVNPDCRNSEKLIVNDDLTISVPTELSKFTKDGANGGSDILTVIYRADHPNFGPMVFDCAGSGYKASSSLTVLEKQISCSTDRENEEVVGDTAEGMENPAESKIYNGFYIKGQSLICAGSRSTESIPHIIADNIENMQFLYGVFVGGNTEYKKADDVETDGEWESVVSVQVGILVSSVGDVLKTAQSRTYKLLGEDVIKSSKKMMKVYSTTISLNNKIYK
jgi:type IV pilus assembly protein PilW